MTTPHRLDELRVDARYHRERRDLYRAKDAWPATDESWPDEGVGAGLRLIRVPSPAGRG